MVTEYVYNVSMNKLLHTIQLKVRYGDITKLCTSMEYFIKNTPKYFTFLIQMDVVINIIC